MGKLERGRRGDLEKEEGENWRGKKGELEKGRRGELEKEGGEN